MISLVYLTTASPSKLGAELEIAGYRVFETLSISEVLHRQENEKIDAVIIGPDVPNAEDKECLLRGTVMRLKTHATAAYLHWELSRLFPEKNASVQ